MIQQRTPRLPRRAVTISALTFSLSLSVSFPVPCAAQTVAPTASKSTVFTNPRASSDDPRIGLKGGLYDAGQAAFGLELLTSLPKPPGFAPGNSIVVPALPPPPPAAGEPAPPPTIPGQYGSTNSDMAFSGNHLFVGNYNGINTYDIDNPARAKLRMSLM